MFNRMVLAEEEETGLVMGSLIRSDYQSEG